VPFTASPALSWILLEAMLGHGLLDDRVCTEDGSLCQKRDVLLVSSTQSGNPVLRNIYNVRWSFSSVVPDFSLSASSCVIFLSARFHVLHPEYLHSRIQQMRNNLNFCFVLCIVDMEDSVNVLCDINKTSTVQDCTLVCSWSLEESARYLETRVTQRMISREQRKLILSVEFKERSLVFAA
jgi:DNA repair protein Rad10